MTDRSLTVPEHSKTATLVSRLTDESQAASSHRPSNNRDGNSGRDSAALRAIYHPIASELEAVEARFHQELQSQYESLVPVLRHGLQLGGKRLRPALLLLTSQAARHNQVVSDQVSSDDLIVMATVIEMVHTATLIHDDVLDTATTRRHVPTINARWNDDTSILLGDYLFAQSFYLAATLPSTLACRWVGKAAQAVCEGELRQVLGRDWLDIDEETYLDIIRGKTAELTRVACQLGAQLSGADQSTVEAFGKFGNDLGIAFQIADDYLDLWGDDQEVGKTLGTDLQQGKITLPLIRLLNHEDQVIASRTREALQASPNQRFQRVMPILRQSDAANDTRKTAERFRASAIAALDDVMPSAALESLHTIANFSVDRRF